MILEKRVLNYGLKLISINIIASSYPEQINIIGIRFENKKFLGQIWVLKDKSPHYAIVTTNTEFDSEQLAVESLKEVCKDCVEFQKRKKQFKEELKIIQNWNDDFFMFGKATKELDDFFGEEVFMGIKSLSGNFCLKGVDYTVSIIKKELEGLTKVLKEYKVTINNLECTHINIRPSSENIICNPAKLKGKEKEESDLIINDILRIIVYSNVR